MSIDGDLRGHIIFDLLGIDKINKIFGEKE